MDSSVCLVAFIEKGDGITLPGRKDHGFSKDFTDLLTYVVFGKGEGPEDLPLPSFVGRGIPSYIQSEVIDGKTYIRDVMLGTGDFTWFKARELFKVLNELPPSESRNVNNVVRHHLRKLLMFNEDVIFVVGFG